MSDHNMLDLSGRSRLRADISWLMLRGAGMAAVLVLGVWLVLAVIAAIGRQLPPESRDAADPTPEAAMMVPAGSVRIG